MTSPSGVSELDDEAVRAFHAAAPFPNPPEGLVKDDLITFAFAFYFEIGAVAHVVARDPRRCSRAWSDHARSRCSASVGADRRDAVAARPRAGRRRVPAVDVPDVRVARGRRR